MPFDESHVDDDLLALLALGEPAGSTSDLAHIEECERCTDELESLREVVELARSGGPDDALVAPAPARVGPHRRRARALARRPGAGHGRRAGRARRRAGRAARAGGPARRPPRAGPAPGAGSPPRRPPGSLVGGGGAWWVANHDDPATVLATATLEPLPGWDASGLRGGRDGGRRQPRARRRPVARRPVRRGLPRGLAAQARRQRPGQRRHARGDVRAVRPARRASTCRSTRWSTCPRSSSTATPRTPATRSCAARCRPETADAPSRVGGGVPACVARQTAGGAAGGCCCWTGTCWTGACWTGAAAGAAGGRRRVRRGALLDDRAVRRVAALAR